MAPDREQVSGEAEVPLSEQQMIALVQAIDVSTPEWKIRNENLRLRDVLMDALASLRASRAEPLPVDREQGVADLGRTVAECQTAAAHSALREQPAGLREELTIADIETILGEADWIEVTALNAKLRRMKAALAASPEKGERARRWGEHPWERHGDYDG